LATNRKYLLICALCLWAIPACAQITSGSNWGFNVGAVTALGNRFQRVGLTVQSYYCYNYLQGNVEVRAYHNFRNLGPRKRYNELVASAGLVLGYGATQGLHNPFLSVVSNQTGHVNSIGYAQNFYFNKIKTVQWTGTIAVQLNNISIISENDIFARSTLDRFRTGGLLVQYQYKDLYQIAANCTMWTGQMGNNKITDDGDFPFVGYMDTTNGVYTNYSHGLLSGQFKMALNNGQNLQANAGIDAEQVRNFVQNRLIHDMIPGRRKVPQNCHIPMLDTAGHQYLYKPGQTIKPARPYWNIFSSPAIFY